MIKPNFRKKSSSDLTLRKKFFKIIILLAAIMIIIRIILGYIEPIFEAMCEEKVQSIATIITNQQSTIIMNKYQYEQLYTTEKDENGNIVIIKK